MCGREDDPSMHTSCDIVCQTHADHTTCARVHPTGHTCMTDYGNPATGSDYVWARRRANELRRKAFAKATYSNYCNVVHGNAYEHTPFGNAWLSEKRFGCPAFIHRR